MRKNILRVSAFILSVIFMASAFVSCGKKVDNNNNDKTEGESTVSVAMTEEETTAAPEKKSISFLACGDNIIHECVYLDAMTQATASGSASDYYFDNMYSNVEDMIKSADISFINAEGPLDTDYKASGYPNFNAPKEAGEALVNVGFDIINLANNHMLDLNSNVGMRGTIDYWKDKNVLTIGAYEGEDDYNTIRYIERDGVKIALLSYTYSTNGNKLPTDETTLWVPYIDDADITRHIAEAKEKYDLVFVSMHWGQENEFSPNAEQKRLAQLIADCGADVIIGHHSHTIQPVEWVTGKNGNNTLVTYSLGNFLHTQLKDINLVGSIFTFDINEKDGGGYAIENPVFTPTVCHYTADTNVLDSLEYYKRENLKIYKLSEYTEELAAQHGSQYWTKFTLDTLKGYVNSTIDREFLPADWK